MGRHLLLLVNRRAALTLAAGAVLGPLAICAAAASRDAPVDAADHDAFWLWAGVRSQPVLAGARTLYFLQGEVLPPGRAGGTATLVAQSGATPHVRAADVWLTYRAATLDWPPLVYAQVLARLERWRAAGQPVLGLQVDFDAGTRRLDRYVRFLRDLRARLPDPYRLSVTGLLDWSRHASTAEFASLGEVVDEVVLQTYQGRRTIPDYGAYVAGLMRLRLPFKVGLVQGGDWRAPPGLAGHPWFRGYVVFLVNPPGTR